MGSDTEEERIHISTDSIRLDQLLKLSGVAATGGHAKLLVQDGKVKVNGTVETRRGLQLFDGDMVTIEGGSTLRVVRRGGQQGGEQ